MKKIIILLVFLGFSSTAIADEKYKYCEISGIASGADDGFIRSLTDRIMDKQSLSFDKVCSSVRRDSYNFGRQYSQGTNLSNADHLRWQKYQNYRDEVMDSIIKIVGY